MLALERSLENREKCAGLRKKAKHESWAKT